MKQAEAVRRIAVYAVLPPRTLLLDAAGPLEVLRRANMVQDAVRFDVRYIGPARSASTSIGLTVTGIAPFPPTLPDGAMVVVAGDVDAVMSPDVKRTAADDHDDAINQARIIDWLRAAIRPGHRLVTICSGALLAARAGLLDGYKCTTHYLSSNELAEIAPRANVLDNRLYVDDGERCSSAGVTAGIDLMLYLVSQMVDHVCALAVARYLVVYLRRSGADPQLSPWLEGRNHLHPAVHRVQDAMTASPAKPWTLAALAKIAGASPRHLSRLFNEHVGMNMADYRNRLRVALAHELIGHTRLDMERVAERAGFASTRQFRRVWHRLYAGSPRQVRSAAR
ncbi:MAG: helix-turn-helix domain-containing protein [Rudaea sp.]|nr:helix-turn-helix domain-containing protein [Rudaea sp.]